MDMTTSNVRKLAVSMVILGPRCLSWVPRPLFMVDRDFHATKTSMTRRWLERAQLCGAAAMSIIAAIGNDDVFERALKLGGIFPAAASKPAAEVSRLF